MIKVADFVAFDGDIKRISLFVMVKAGIEGTY